MKKHPCLVPGCKERRRHHKDPDTPRGVQYVEVPDDWPDDRPAFCSMTCAIRGGYTSVRAVTEPCPGCLADGVRVQHHGTYKCWRLSEPTG